MGQMRKENARDAFEVRQLAVKEDQLTNAIGLDDDYFEVIPGYNTKSVKSKATVGHISNDLL